MTNNAALVISVLALLFTVFSFWWMNWRVGKLHVGDPRIYAAHGSDGGDLFVELPFVFFNDGPTPIIIENLRLIFLEETYSLPLVFVATVAKVGKDDGRAFATQFPVRGREAVLIICEFQRRPGRMIFKQHRYPMELQARLGSSERWQPLKRFTLIVTERDLVRINSALVVHDDLSDA